MLMKKEALNNLEKRSNINVFGAENLTTDEPVIFVANHNCLMDIFYLPASLPIATVSLISSRLIYKPIEERKAIVNKLLHSMPIEAHGGPKYSSMCLNKSLELLKKNISINIFPEGAYIEPSDKIFKGRTGAARILYNSKSSGLNLKIIPVAIQIISENLNLDSYNTINDTVNVYILPEIDYSTYYKSYITSTNKEKMNIALHSVIDDSMKAIAKTLNKTYCDEYIELWSKKNVMFKDDSTVNVDDAQAKHYLSLYEKELDKRLNSILKSST